MFENIPGFDNWLNTMLAQQALPTAVPPKQTPIDSIIQSATNNPSTNEIKVSIPTPSPEDEQTKLRKEYRGQAESAFGADYAQKNIASTLLDDTINSILGEQRGGAETYLDRGRKRGIYNDVGYNAGLARIGTDADAGRSRLNSLGLGVIDKYRADANAVRDKAYGAVSGFTPGNAFSLDPYINEGREVIDRARTFGGGDLRNAFGGTQLFDFGGLNNRAGQAQGAINSPDNDVLGAITNRRRANSFGRGLGSRGVF